MSTRWLVNLTLASLVTLGLAAATAAAIGALVPLMMAEPPSWLTPRLLQAADVVVMLFAVAGLARLFVRWRQAKASQRPDFRSR